MGRAVIGRNEQREAARAVFDALPFLKQADEVELCINPQEEGSMEEDLPITKICSALSRHRV
jgi:hypothetical protein